MKVSLPNGRLTPVSSEPPLSQRQKKGARRTTAPDDPPRDVRLTSAIDLAIFHEASGRELSSRGASRTLSADHGDLLHR